MKYTIQKCCKTLAATTLAAGLAISLGISTAPAQGKPAQGKPAQGKPAQEAPGKSQSQEKIKLQKVDGPRRTGRTRPTDKNQIKQIERAEKQRQLPKGAQQSALNRSKSSPNIKQLGPEKTRELRSRIHAERIKRIRDTQFQQERTKNIRRLVQIERIRQLAEQNQNQNLLDRANELRDKEIQRHTLKLSQLRKKISNANNSIEPTHPETKN